MIGNAIGNATYLELTVVIALVYGLLSTYTGISYWNEVRKSVIESKKNGWNLRIVHRNLRDDALTLIELLCVVSMTTIALVNEPGVFIIPQAVVSIIFPVALITMVVCCIVRSHMRRRDESALA